MDNGWHSGEGSHGDAAPAAEAQRLREPSHRVPPFGPGPARLAFIGSTGAGLLVAGLLATRLLVPATTLSIPWVPIVLYMIVASVALGGMGLAARLASGARDDEAVATRFIAGGVPTPAEPDAGGPLMRFQVDTRGGRRVMEASQVEWFEASGNYARLHAAGGSFLYRRPLAQLEEQLDASRFLRVHRSAIVNLQAIREVSPLASGDVELTMASGARVRVSRRFARAFHDATGRSH